MLMFLGELLTSRSLVCYEWHWVSSVIALVFSLVVPPIVSRVPIAVHRDSTVVTLSMLESHDGGWLACRLIPKCLAVMGGSYQYSLINLSFKGLAFEGVGSLK